MELRFPRASQVALMVKNPLANAEDTGDLGSIPGPEDLLEGDMATQSSILAWKIPWTEEPGRLQSMITESDMTEPTDHAHACVL